MCLIYEISPDPSLIKRGTNLVPDIYVIPPLEKGTNILPFGEGNLRSPLWKRGVRGDFYERRKRKKCFLMING
jgi:hypothetical protein